MLNLFFAERQRAGREQHKAHQEEYKTLRPQFGQPRPAQDDSTQDLDQVGGWDQFADPLKYLRHTFHGEYVPRQEESRQHRRVKQLHRLRLRARPRRDQQAQSEHRQNIWNREKQQKEKVSAHGYVEDPSHNRQDEAEFRDANDQVGRHLSGHQTQRFDRRHIELV